MALRGRIIAQGMLREGTPIENYVKQFGLWVKREDLACLNPGPPFSKTRGVYAHIRSRLEKTIGVLDTYHSQGGWAVARACQILHRKCIVFYPEFKHEPGYRYPQKRAQALGAELVGLPAGRSAILFHAARKVTESRGGYMMPNALKLEESISETAREVPKEHFDYVLISISSGTIAAGVIRGMGVKTKYLIHLGYSRSHDQVSKYLREASGISDADITLIDEKYTYKDLAKEGINPTWPCNPWYDLKAFRWFCNRRKQYHGKKVLFWNIG